MVRIKVMLLTSLSTIFKPYRGDQIYWWREQEDLVGEKYQPATSHWQTLYHIMLHRVHLAMNGIRIHNINGDEY